MEPPHEDDLELIEHARRIALANGDDEVHTVGAAVRDARGRIFGGINVDHFLGGPAPSSSRSATPARPARASSPRSSRTRTGAAA